MSISYNKSSYTMLLYLLPMSLMLRCRSSPLKQTNKSSTHSCHNYESLALLRFKDALTIVDYNDSPYPIAPKTKSWKNDTDCCNWEGIKCDNETHHVVDINLRSSGLQGAIHSNSSIFLLRHLQYLSLSQNDMSSSTISPRFGEFRFLKHLDLSFSSLIGQVPLEIARLTQLRYLDLSGNFNLNMPNFSAIIANLTELRHVDFGFVNVNDQIPNSLLNLSSLTYLGLQDCQLKGELPVNILKLPHLIFLDISENLVYSNVKLFQNWSTSLEYLDLSFVNFSSSLPPFLPGRQPHHLSVLRLKDCNLQGTIPTWVWNTSEQIDLGSNYLTSPSADFLSKITGSTLVQIALDQNDLQGNISLYDDILSKLPNLQGLMLSNSGLSVTLTNGPDTNSSSSSSTWANSLQALFLSSTNIHSDFPSWTWYAWKDTLYVLDLSHNSITGGLPVRMPWTNLIVFDISYNLFHGPLPLPEVGVYEFSAASNKLTGVIDSSICQFTSLTLLDLSNNSLGGEFPHCLANLSDDLAVLNLGSNNIQGTLPASFSKCSGLEYLDLSNNLLHGLVPRSLSSCQSLQILNLKNNRLTDKFPFWLQNLPLIRILDLGSNNFQGRIPHSYVKHPFPMLQVINLSNNNFSGRIPASYISNFRGMMNASDTTGGLQYMSTVGNNTFYAYSISLTFNGVDNDYTKIISTLTTIDLSDNDFTGEIPDNIGQLLGLHGLNLSHNRLTGHIPASLGSLSMLDFLDLSNNKLTGEIPQELVNLTSLGVFNVSSNMLVGTIPHGNNFDTFQPESYKGNLGLCGFPLPDCGSRHGRDPTVDGPTDSDATDDEGMALLVEWKVVLIGCGFGTIVGMSWGYYILSVGKPFWFTKFAYKIELLVVRFYEKRFRKRARRT